MKKIKVLDFLLYNIIVRVQSNINASIARSFTAVDMQNYHLDDKYRNNVREGCYAYHEKFRTGAYIYVHG